MRTTKRVRTHAWPLCPLPWHICVSIRRRLGQVPDPHRAAIVEQARSCRARTPQHACHFVSCAFGLGGPLVLRIGGAPWSARGRPTFNLLFGCWGSERSGSKLERGGELRRPQDPKGSGCSLVAAIPWERGHTRPAGCQSPTLLKASPLNSDDETSRVDRLGRWSIGCATPEFAPRRASLVVGPRPASTARRGPRPGQ